MRGIQLSRKKEKNLRTEPAEYNYIALIYQKNVLVMQLEEQRKVTLMVYEEIKHNFKSILS